MAHAGAERPGRALAAGAAAVTGSWAAGPAEDLLQGDAAVLPGSQDPDHQVGADAQDGEQERDEHQQADQPHIEPEGRGEAARDPGEEALRAAAEAETTQGIEEVRHVVNDRQARGFAQWGQPTGMMKENQRSTARRSAGNRPETRHLTIERKNVRKRT